MTKSARAAVLCAIAALGAPALGEETFKETLRSRASDTIPAYRPHAVVSGPLNSVGTDTMEDLMNAWMAGFRKAQPGVRMQQEAKGSMTAAPGLSSGRAQLAPISREMMPDELANFITAKGYAPRIVRVALGSYRTPTKTVALTFYVNEKNPVTRLTFRQLDAMYCTGRKRGAPSDITTWGQVGATGDWAHRPIHPVGVMQPDGISNYIRLLICKDGTFKPNVMEEKIDHSDGAVSVLTRIVRDVENDPDAVGYAGFHNRQPHSRQVAVADTAKGPFLMGSFDEVASARYPITRFVYILVDQKPGQPLAPGPKEFLRYVLSRDGQKAVENEGIFMPLPASIARQEAAKLQ